MQVIDFKRFAGVLDRSSAVARHVWLLFLALLPVALPQFLARLRVHCMVLASQVRADRHAPRHCDGVRKRREPL